MKKINSASNPNPSTSASQHTRTNNPNNNNTGRVEENDEDEDVTCCRRATFCIPMLREIIVTNPISTCFDMKFTWANLFWIVTITGIIFMAWTVFYLLLNDTMLPGGKVFGLFVLIVFSYVFGWTLALIPYMNIPPIFGMLLAGIIVRNSDFYNIHEELGADITSKIRTFCVTFIMIRAGLQLTTTSLRKNPLFILILAIVPCTMEMLILSISINYILHYPWDWAFMAGSIITCMSPVITVNCMLTLAEQGYGEDKGLASILCAAASIDDVHIISLFTIFHANVFSNLNKYKKEWWSYIPGGLRDILVGVIVGVALGTFLAFFPHRGHKYATWYRFTGLVFASLMCTTAALKIAVSGGAFLATMIMSYIAITGWRILTVSYNTAPLLKAARFLWHFMQPILVGVIGANIDLKNWSLTRFGLYTACSFIGIITRCIVVYATTFVAKFSWKERLFIALSWMSKGTLQAAFAPMAYEYTVSVENDPQKVELAIDLIKLSVTSIMFFAPLGAIVMMSTGPLLLNKITIEEQERDRYISYLRTLNLQPIIKHKKKIVDSNNVASVETK